MGRHRRLRGAQRHPMGTASAFEHTAEPTESASAAEEMRDVDYVLLLVERVSRSAYPQNRSIHTSHLGKCCTVLHDDGRGSQPRNL